MSDSLNKFTGASTPIRLGSNKSKHSQTSIYIQTQIDLKLSSASNKKNMQSASQLLINDRIEQAIRKVISKIQQLTKFAQNTALEHFFTKSGAGSAEVCNNLKKIASTIQQISQNIKSGEFNFNIVQNALQFLVAYLDRNNLQNQPDSQKAIAILDFQFKSICCLDLLIRSLNLPDDITTLPKQKFDKVWSCIRSQNCGVEAEVSSQLAFMKRIMGITTSAVLNEHEQSGAFTKVFAFGLSYPHYYFSNSEYIFRSMNFYRKPTIEMAQNIWNLPQNGLTKQISKLSLKSIQTNIKIYVPCNQTSLPEDICQYNPDAIKVRILHNDALIFANKKPPLNLFCCGMPNSTPNQITNIIIHFHGGGFVALSSRSVQTYTTKWARELRIPVFSVDYRKPPSHRFPTAPYDCLAVYSFIVKHIHRYFNIHPEKIILAGDSAGGNLACSLMGLILKNRLPSPHGIFLAYPACDLRKIFSPSRTFSFSDPLLNPSMLMLCLKEYLNDNQSYETDPLASPILLTEEYVKGTKGDQRFPIDWPHTIIQVGEQDPLFDDSLRLLSKMVQSGVKCECQAFKNLSHGFLSLDFIVPACSQTIRDSIEHLRKLLL